MAATPFHGDFSPWYSPIALIEKAHALGISVGITATCIAEATAIAAAGADFVVAQGWEAGGHRGRFDTTEIDQEQDLLVLVQAMAERISLPIVAWWTYDRRGHCDGFICWSNSRPVGYGVSLLS